MTILTMGIASFAMALLPSYQTADITASILFVLLRIVQGAAVGEEIPSAIVFIKETLIKNGGFACGVIFCFINMGIFFAEVTETITTSFLSDEYAWRVAFISGGIAASAISLEKKYMRLKLSSTKRKTLSYQSFRSLKVKKMQL